MIFQYTLPEKEYRRILLLMQKRLMRLNRRIWIAAVLNSIAFVVLGVLLMMAIDVPNDRNLQSGVLIRYSIVFVFVGLVVAHFLWHTGYSKVMVVGSHLLNQPRTLSVFEDRLEFTAGLHSSVIHWSAVRSVEVFEGAVCVFFDRLAFMPIAASAFASQTERDEFLQFANAQIANARMANVRANIEKEDVQLHQVDSSHPAEHFEGVAQLAPTVSMTPSIPAPTPAPRWQNAIHLLAQNILNAFKLALLIPVPAAKMPVMWWQCLVFPLLITVIAFLLAFAEIGPNGQFRPASISGVLLPISLLLFAGIATAYFARQPEKSLASIQMLLMTAFGVDAIVLVISLVAHDFSISSFSHYGAGLVIALPTIWLGVASMVAMARLFQISLVPILISIILIVLPLSIPFRDVKLWDESFETMEARSREFFRHSITAEDNFYRQSQLLNDELAALTPQRSGVPEIFFIGMAGDGHQDVFRKEVDAVATLMQERFDATGHTIKLINNANTIATSPIASKTSLQAALSRTAATMDIEEDVLVLFLTSHGSEDHRFSLTLSSMQFKEIDPAGLRKTLDDSGIKNRVVIISACYSGGFVEALKNDNTLVIAAAAPDRQSFGCSNESEWTYFGKAYFDEALRQTTSFTEAFTLAIPVIADREASKGYTKSDPRIAEGIGIRVKLAAIEQRLNKITSIKSASTN